MSELTDLEVVDLMGSAGIPKRYREKDKRLRDVTDNKALLSLVKDRGRLRRRANDTDGFALIGEKREVAYMFARSLLLSGVGVSCATLPKLYRALNYTKSMEELVSQSCLCLLDFHNRHWRKFPLGEQASYELELYLQRFVEEGGILVLDVDVRVEDMNWWSGRFKSALDILSFEV